MTISSKNPGVELHLRERGLRHLARASRVRGATRAAAEWVIPTPVEVIPGKRGPAGVAFAT